MTESVSPGKPLVGSGVWILVLAGILGLLFFFAKFDESFPAASIDLKTSKNQIESEAKTWAGVSGYDINSAIFATIFTYDDYGKTFLEYELGQAKANELMRSEIPIWYWNTRFCKPFKIEECSVWVSPDGKMRAFRRELENDRKMPSIPHAQAQKMAEDFLTERVGMTLADLKLIKNSESKQVHRTDHDFTWENQRKDFKGGKLRTYMSISGDTVTDYNTYLYVPEKFTHKFNEIRSYNNVLKNVSSIFYSILSSAIAFAFLWAFASGRIRWKFAIVTGAVCGVLEILNWANSIPNLIYSYSPTMSFDGYVVDKIIAALWSGGSTVFGYAIMFGALEAVYRVSYPKKVAIEKILNPLGLRSRPVVEGLLAGIGLFGVHCAYVVIYYLAGQKFGVWSPLEVRDASTLSTYFPFLSAVWVGVTAASSEELMYRVLGLSLAQKIVKNFWVANLIQAAAWAFMHSDYPQEPAWSRGLELTIGGFFYGFILKRFGLLPCILAHYTYDAFLGITPMFSSPNPVVQATSLLAVIPGAVALVVSAVLIARRGWFTDEESLSNAAVPVKQPIAVDDEKHPPMTFYYRSLPNLVRVLLIVFAVGAIALRAILPLQTVGQEANITIDRAKAIQIARDYLQNRGVSTAGMMETAWVFETTDVLELQYVFEKVKFGETKRLSQKIGPPIVWVVRFFRPLDPHRWEVTMTANGRPIAINDVRDEDDPGAQLEQQKARDLVDKYIGSEHAEFNPIEFLESSKQERKKRIDYRFTYKVPHLKVAEADYKISSGTIGDSISGFSEGWQIPDQWIFEKQKVSTDKQIFGYVRGFWALVIFIMGIIWGVGIIRSNLIRWRPAIYMGIFAAVLALLGDINELPTLFFGYDTDVPLKSFYINAIVSDLTGMFYAASAMVMGVAFAYASYRIIFPNLPFKAIAETMIYQRKDTAVTRRNFWLDAIIVGYTSVLIFGGVDYLFEVARALISPSVKVVSLNGIAGIADDLSPGFGALVSAIQAGMWPVTVVAVAVAMKKRFFTKTWKLLLFIVVTLAIQYSGERYIQDYSLNLASSIVSFLLMYFLIARLARMNVLAYFFAGYAGALIGTLRALSKNGWPLFLPDVIMISIFLLLPLCYVVWLYAISMSKKSADVSPT